MHVLLIMLPPPFTNYYTLLISTDTLVYRKGIHTFISCSFAFDFIIFVQDMIRCYFFCSIYDLILLLWFNKGFNCITFVQYMIRCYFFCSIYDLILLHLFNT